MFLAAAVIRIPGINRMRMLVDCISVAVAAVTTVLAAILYSYSAETPVVHWIGCWIPREETVTGISLVADGISSGFIFLASALTGAALIRFSVRLLRPADKNQEDDPVFTREGSRETEKRGGIMYMTAIPAVLLVVGFIIPLFPQMMSGFEKASENDFDRSRYVESVLTGEIEPAEDPSPHDIWKAGDLAKGIISALFAVIAGAAAASRRFDFGRITGGPLGFIRNLHSGHVGDYLIWLMLGIALTTAWLLWQL